jgi:hypothetical protein
VVGHPPVGLHWLWPLWLLCSCLVHGSTAHGDSSHAHGKFVPHEQEAVVVVVLGVPSTDGDVVSPTRVRRGGARALAAGRGRRIEAPLVPAAVVRALLLLRLLDGMICESGLHL